MELGRAGYVTLLTGASLVVSGIIQAKSEGLTVYHALILLNLSWITVFTAVPTTYALQLLFVFGIPGHAMPLGLKFKLIKARSWESHSHTAFQLTILHTLHLSVTAGFGLWLFSNIKDFDSTAGNCTSSTVYSVFGYYPVVVSARFRQCWLVVYGIASVPMLNLGVIVISMFFGFRAGCIAISFVARAFEKDNVIGPLKCAIHVLPPALVLLLLIIGTERTVLNNNVGPGEETWTLGQTFTLSVALIPTVDLISYIRRANKSPASSPPDPHTLPPSIGTLIGVLEQDLEAQKVGLEWSDGLTAVRVVHLPISLLEC